MRPLDSQARGRARARLGLQQRPGLLALRHALENDRPGLWVDDPTAPRAIVLLREGDDGLDAFGAGDPIAAVSWLRGLGRPVALHGPDSWGAALGGGHRAEVQTWSEPSAIRPPSSPTTRPLDPGDASAFRGLAPSWALRGWGTFENLIQCSNVFGVDGPDGLAAAAWGFDRAGGYESVGVWVDPRYRRLGLGRRAASAMVARIAGDGRSPTWSVAPGNAASVGLARSLGFRHREIEGVWRRG